MFIENISSHSFRNK